MKHLTPVFPLWLISLFVTAQSIAAAADQPAPLDALVSSANLWEVAPETFIEEQRGSGFHWVSEAKTSAETTASGLMLFGVPVTQAISRFDGGHLGELTVLFYARGDAGELTEAAFRDLYGKVTSGVTGFAGAEGTVLGRDPSGAVKAHGIEWKTAASDLRLEYSVTKEVKTRGIPFRAEFVRLTLRPVEKPQGLLQKSLSERAAANTRFTGRDHVVREDSGDVLLRDVPMVDQGPKGYCVVASAERVLRYYGGTVDQHELAQIANSSASGGTSLDAMLASLKSLSNRLRIRVRAIETFGVRDLLDMVKDYNRLAKRGNRAQEVQTGQVLVVPTIYAQMKPEILKESRTRNKADMNRFFRGVQTNIDEGVPLLWCVMLGVVPEPEIPQASGGHMRLIIGYNGKTNEILYTDSWGRGHEKKRMALPDAWTITNSTSTIEPI